jgi:hypothetical protein
LRRGGQGEIMKSVVGNLAYDWIAENGSAIREMLGIHNQLIYTRGTVRYFRKRNWGSCRDFSVLTPTNRVMEIIT